MAARAPKGTVKTAKPEAKKVDSQETAKADPPTIRQIANKVARMGLKGRLRIFVLAGLMTEEEAQAAAEHAAKVDRAKREKKRAAKKGGRKSSS
jgi:hypothetical protein